MSMPKACTTNCLAGSLRFRKPRKPAFVVPPVVRLGVVPGVTSIRRNRLQGLVSRSIRRSVCPLPQRWLFCFRMVTEWYFEVLGFPAGASWGSSSD